MALVLHDNKLYFTSFFMCVKSKCKYQIYIQQPMGLCLYVVPYWLFIV